MDRIPLSIPYLSGHEKRAVERALESGWVTTLGPELEAFEEALRERVRVGHALALSSGTAAVHLALRVLDVAPGDLVFCSTLTFVASAGPILYERAVPVFVDSERRSWNLDPELLAEELGERSRRGRPLPRALIVTDVFGQCADLDAINRVCGEYSVPVIEDACQALGATYRGRPAGSLADLGVLSFNGNKIVTSGGGGALLSDRAAWIDRARHLASQARDPAPHYEHSTVGYNYRLSNVLAALGRAQLELLDERVQARQRNFDTYARGLGDLPGLELMPEAEYGRASRWLTCLTLDPAAFGASREQLRLRLDAAGMEARPLWKPMHLQPLFADAQVVAGAVAEDLFEHGLCLPSSSSLEPHQLQRVIEVVRQACRAR